MEEASIDEDSDARFFDDEIGPAPNIARLRSPASNSVCFQQRRKSLFRSRVPGRANRAHILAASLGRNFERWEPHRLTWAVKAAQGKSAQ